nr:MerR family transcriptional regulator [Longispora albida]
MSAAADMAGVTPAFLRSLGACGLLDPGRSGGGHRRYSRAELDLAMRVRDVASTGVSLAAACRIVELEGRLAAARAEIAALRAAMTGSGGQPAT